MVLNPGNKYAARWMSERALFASRVSYKHLHSRSEASIVDATQLEGGGRYEVSNGSAAFTVHRLYTAAELDPVYEVLALAELRWPSQFTNHTLCQECWLASPCLAIRVWWVRDEFPHTAPLYVQTGCGVPASVLPSLEEKLYFLRSHGVDAFIAWVPVDLPY